MSLNHREHSKNLLLSVCLNWRKKRKIVTEDSEFDVGQWSMTLLRLIPRCQWHCWAWFYGVRDIAELDSAVSMTLLNLIPRCQWHCWAWFRDINYIAELDSAGSVTLLSLIPRYQWHSELDSAVSMTLLRLIPRYQWHCWAWFRGVNDTAEVDSVVSMT